MLYCNDQNSTVIIFGKRAQNAIQVRTVESNAALSKVGDFAGEGSMGRGRKGSKALCALFIEPLLIGAVLIGALLIGVRLIESLLIEALLIGTLFSYLPCRLRARTRLMCGW